MAILNYFSGALTQYASHEHTIRDHMKAVRSREEAFDELKRRRKSVTAKAEAAERKLNKMSPEHKNLPAQTETLNNLREEIRHLNAEIVTEEAALGDFKRTTTRAWMGLKFGGLLECCEKGMVSILVFGSIQSTNNIIFRLQENLANVSSQWVILACSPGAILKKWYDIRRRFQKPQQNQDTIEHCITGSLVPKTGCLKLSVASAK